MWHFERDGKMNSTAIDIDMYLSMIYVVVLCRDVNTQSEAVFFLMTPK